MEIITENQLKIKPKFISDYSATIYGGKGFTNNIRIVIALYDDTGKLTAWIRFHEDQSKIEKDSIDDTGIITMNLPVDLYQSVLFTLRSNRPIKMLFDENTAMLMELKFEPPPPSDKIPKEKVN